MSIDSTFKDGVLTISLRETEARNALDLSTVIDFRSALAEARNDDGLRLVTVTSSLDRIFSLGMNLEKLDAEKGARVWDSFEAISDFAELLIDDPLDAEVVLMEMLQSPDGLHPRFCGEVSSGPQFLLDRFGNELTEGNSRRSSRRFGLSQNRAWEFQSCFRHHILVSHIYGRT